MVSEVQDFRAEFPLVDPETGLATPEFLRFLQQRGGSLIGAEDDASSALTAAQSAQTTADTAQTEVNALEVVVAGLGIDDLTDVDTTTSAPTDGQALVWVDADSEWVPGDVASGGGGGGSNLSPPSSSDYSLLNDGGVTTLTDETPGLVLAVGTGGSGTQLRCAVKTAPSTPYEIAWKQRSLAKGSATDAQGFICRNSSSGMVMKFGVAVNNNIPSIDLEKWNSVSSYNSNVTSSSAGGYELNYFRFRNDGTSIYFDIGFSLDGPWINVHNETIATFMSAVDQIGWAVEDQNLSDYLLLIEDYAEA